MDDGAHGKRPAGRHPVPVVLVVIDESGKAVPGQGRSPQEEGEAARRNVAVLGRFGQASAVAAAALWGPATPGV